MGCMELSLSSCAEIGVPIDLRRCLRETLELAKGIQANCPVRWKMGHCSEANAGELVIILS